MAGNTTQTAFRLSNELLARVDGYRDRLRDRHGVEVSRTGAVAGLLGMALDALDVLEAAGLPADAAEVRRAVKTMGRAKPRRR